MYIRSYVGIQLQYAYTEQSVNEQPASRKWCTRVQMNCVYIRMYTATRIECVCTGILALLTVVGGYSCTITQIYFYTCLHVCTIAVDLLNTNVNSVKSMPAATAHALMHVHTLTLSHTCAHKAHTRTYMLCFLQCPLPPRTTGERDQPCCLRPQHCGDSVQVHHHRPAPAN